MESGSFGRIGRGHLRWCSRRGNLVFTRAEERNACRARAGKTAGSDDESTALCARPNCALLPCEAGGDVFFAMKQKRPNKAPEPTPGLVTPRAIESASEVKRLILNRDVARGAPSPVVAHL